MCSRPKKLTLQKERGGCDANSVKTAYLLLDFPIFVAAVVSFRVMAIRAYLNTAAWSQNLHVSRLSPYAECGIISGRPKAVTQGAASFVTPVFN
jgi:hypothetical protein